MLWRADEHEELTERAWDEARARAASREIVADAEEACADGFWPGHPGDDAPEEPALCTLYLGSAGMIWALWEMGSSIDGRDLLARVIERYRGSPDFGREAHAPSLWMGETGLLVVARRVGSPLADQDRLRELVLENRDHPTWELMWGSPGTMLAARACGLDDEWRQSAEMLLDRWDPATDVWTQSLYGRVAEILGPAHGFAFLKLLALTGDERWLERARHFAMHAIEQVARERDRVGRGRYTLWTGDIGVALYLRACLDGNPSFPTMDSL
jgi:hypothetical protein